MKRKDGRELVTEHPVTWEDMIDVIPAGEYLPSEGATACSIRRAPEDDLDIGEWNA